MIKFLRKLFLIFTTVVMTLAAAPEMIAMAHEVTPLTASPAPGQVLQQSPSQVILTFEEEITEDGSTLQVLDDQGKQVDLGNGGVDLNDAKHATMVVGLPQLAEGIFLVKWQVTLTDGDASQGEYHFGIGNVTLPADPVDESSADSPPSTGTLPVLWIALGTGLILLVLAMIFFLRKARSSA